MVAPAIFGINSGGLNLFVNLVLLSLVVVWFATIYWTYADARRRLVDLMLVGCATAAALFPFVGAVVYMIVRPPEFLDDVRERELEMQASQARLAQLGFLQCPECRAEVERDFVRCPSCRQRLKNPCVRCSRPLDRTWKLCPYCEVEVVSPASAESERQPRRRRRLGAAAEQAAATEAPASAPPTTT
ncbi:MAG: zinc ribbon domain-containing protein [Actinomycetota bacterium]|nr:zinc ribbon domain-containing protein [Actinomycetota bacterium]